MAEHDAYDPRLSMPPLGSRVPLRTWWRGVYDHLAIAPHPFRRMFDDADEGGDTAQLMGWREAHRRIAPEVEFLAFAKATWLLSCLGISDLRPDADHALQRHIRRWCERNRWLLPDQDGMPPALESQVGRFLAALGLATITAWDEFRLNGRTIRVDLLWAASPPLELSQAVWALHASDPGVLLAWEIDGTAAFVSMTEAARARVDPADHFECLPVGEATTGDWTRG